PQTRPGPFQQQPVVPIPHRAIRSVAMRGPDRSPIEAFEGRVTTCHVLKAANPHESILATLVTKLAAERHPRRFLGLDELSVEQADERLTLPRFERVLAQFNDGAAVCECDTSLHNHCFGRHSTLRYTQRCQRSVCAS